MRSPEEIRFRLLQEARNLQFFLLGCDRRYTTAPPSTPLEDLPDPAPIIERLRRSPFASQVVADAEKVLAHRFPLLTFEIDTGPHIDWSRDYVNGRSSGLDYFRRIPYLNGTLVGDHKIVWELNRHQHLVLLAMAWRFTGRREFLDQAESHVIDWRAKNPFVRGINWTSTLEVGFRALSWIWLWHLAGEDLSAATRQSLLEGLAEHAFYLEYNLSIYFSPNTHLLGEALALETIGRLFPGFPSAAHWQLLGAETVDKQMDVQIRADGSHFEQSSYYQVYTLDMMLWHRVMGGGRTPQFEEKLLAMAEYLDALLGPSGLLYFWGDDDGGRLFHPYGARNAFGRATLATCGVMLGRPGWIHDETALNEQAGWWLGADALNKPRAVRPPRPESIFKDAGMIAIESGSLHILFDAGLFGALSAGHSHADTLAITARDSEEELLIDPGTYTYLSDVKARDAMRGTAAHNTIRINSLDQAVPVNPFRWANPPEVELVRAEHGIVEAQCRYRGFTHAREIDYREPGIVRIRDTVSGPPGIHRIEQFWHLGARNAMVFPADAHVEEHEAHEVGWRSQGLGTREPARYLVRTLDTELPLTLLSVINSLKP